MHKEQSDKRIGAIWCRGNTLCSKTPLSDVFSGAYQRRHNSEVQLIIRRQIHSGISSVSDGGYEIRAAVKAKWPHTNTHTHTYTRLSYTCIYVLWSILHPVDESKTRYGIRRSPEIRKVGQLLKIRYLEITSCRNIISPRHPMVRENTYLGNGTMTSFPNYSKNSLYWNLYFRFFLR